LPPPRNQTKPKTHIPQVEAIKNGTTLVLRCRAAHRHDAAALAAAAKLLRVVPELYTVWNFRREAAQPALDAGIEAAGRLLLSAQAKGEEAAAAADAADGDKAADDKAAAADADDEGAQLEARVAKAEASLDAELDLSQACLQENPKSYCTWHHRRWALDQGVALRGGLGRRRRRGGGGGGSSEGDSEGDGEGDRDSDSQGEGDARGGRALLERELALVARALEADDRNFHAWAHRREIARRLGVGAARELAFAGAKVAADFSNYSAWHQRSLLLGEAVAEEQGRRERARRRQQGREAGAADGGRREQAGSEGGGGQGGEAPVATLDEMLARGATGEGAAGDAGAAAAAAAAATEAAAASSSPPPPAPPQQTPPLPPDVLDAEFDVVHSALATDSRDQSPWVYYAWLVGQALARLRAARAALERAERERREEGGGGDGGLALALARAREADARAGAADRLARERARLEEEHLEDDPDARWPLLTVARLKEAQARLGLFVAVGPPSGGGEGGGDGGEDGGEGGGGGECEGERARLLREAREAYERLATIDPMRAGYYRDAAAGRAPVAIGGEW